MAPYLRSHSRLRRRRWSDIPPEILYLILQRLSLPDRFRFAGICSSWRSTLLASKFCCSARRPPLMVFLLRNNKTTSGHLMVLNGSRPMLLSSPRPTFQRYDIIVGSTFGWLVIASDRKFGLRLLSPISGQKIRLPSTTSDGTQFWRNRRGATCFTVHSVALSSPPTSGDCILVAHGHISGKAYFAYFRLGRDQEWTTFTDHHCRASNIMAFHNGELIVTVDRAGVNGVLIFNFDHHQPNSRTFCMMPNQKRVGREAWFFSSLVSSGGELLLVVQHHQENPEVFKLGPGGWEVVESLGDRVLLLGNHASESFCTQGLMGSGFERDCIYYMLDGRLTKFSMADRSKEMIDIPLWNYGACNYRTFEWVVTHA